jgi:hypothetical protein
LSQQQTSIGVKITDPAKGQQVAIGKNLTLSGTSSYNATSNCRVFGFAPRPMEIAKGAELLSGTRSSGKWKVLCENEN